MAAVSLKWSVQGIKLLTILILLRVSTPDFFYKSFFYTEPVFSGSVSCEGVERPSRVTLL